MKLAYIFLNGELLGSKDFYKNFINNKKGDIYAADGGANFLEELDLLPLELWGDLDSVNYDIVKKYSENDVKISKFPREKDNTDGELLIDYVWNKDYESIVIIGGLGGRKDHELTNINLLSMYNNLIFLTEKETILGIKNHMVFKNLKDKIISFVPLSDKVVNLTLKGFKYDVNNFNLLRGDTRCMSNVGKDERQEVFFSYGKLIGIIQN